MTASYPRGWSATVTARLRATQRQSMMQIRDTLLYLGDGARAWHACEEPREPSPLHIPLLCKACICPFSYVEASQLLRCTPSAVYGCTLIHVKGESASFKHQQRPAESSLSTYGI